MVTTCPFCSISIYDISGLYFCPNCGSPLINNQYIHDAQNPRSKSTAGYNPFDRDYKPWKEPNLLPKRVYNNKVVKVKIEAQQKNRKKNKPWVPIMKQPMRSNGHKYQRNLVALSPVHQNHHLIESVSFDQVNPSTETILYNVIDTDTGYNENDNENDKDSFVPISPRHKLKEFVHPLAVYSLFFPTGIVLVIISLIEQMFGNNRLYWLRIAITDPSASSLNPSNYLSTASNESDSNHNIENISILPKDDFDNNQLSNLFVIAYLSNDEARLIVSDNLQWVDLHAINSTEYYMSNHMQRILKIIANRVIMKQYPNMMLSTASSYDSYQDSATNHSLQHKFSFDSLSVKSIQNMDSDDNTKLSVQNTTAMYQENGLCYRVQAKYKTATNEQLELQKLIEENVRHAVDDSNRANKSENSKDPVPHQIIMNLCDGLNRINPVMISLNGYYRSPSFPSSPKSHNSIDNDHSTIADNALTDTYHEFDHTVMQINHKLKINRNALKCKYCLCSTKMSLSYENQINKFTGEPLLSNKPMFHNVTSLEDFQASQYVTHINLELLPKSFLHSYHDYPLSVKRKKNTQGIPTYLRYRPSNPAISSVYKLFDFPTIISFEIETLLVLMKSRNVTKKNFHLLLENKIKLRQFMNKLVSLIRLEYSNEGIQFIVIGTFSKPSYESIPWPLNIWSQEDTENSNQEKLKTDKMLNTIYDEEETFNQYFFFGNWKFPEEIKVEEDYESDVDIQSNKKNSVIPPDELPEPSQDYQYDNNDIDVVNKEENQPRDSEDEFSGDEENEGFDFSLSVASFMDKCFKSAIHLVIK
eukprot:gene6697-9186_t